MLKKHSTMVFMVWKKQVKTWEKTWIEGLRFLIAGNEEPLEESADGLKVKGENAGDELGDRLV